VLSENTDRSRNPVNANQRNEAACLRRLQQPTLYSCPSNRSFCGEMSSPLKKSVKQLARAPALRQQQSGQMPSHLRMTSPSPRELIRSSPFEEADERGTNPQATPRNTRATAAV
jgi:hypothetical protein